MRELFFFAVGASIVGTIFLVSLVELVFTVKRRKLNETLESQIKEIKTSYNDSINKLVLEEEAKLQNAEHQVETVSAQVEQEKEVLKEEYQQKIDSIQEASEKALDHAKAKAKKLEEEAEMKAGEYLKSRKKEVEQELMDLVLSVSKKVIPTSIPYEIHKELVLKALEDVKTETTQA